MSFYLNTLNGAGAIRQALGAVVPPAPTEVGRVGPTRPGLGPDSGMSLFGTGAAHFAVY